MEPESFAADDDDGADVDAGAGADAADEAVM